MGRSVAAVARDPRTSIVRSGPDEPRWELWQREPHEALREIVVGLWAGGGEPAGARHRVLPNGEILMMLHLGPPQRAVESDGRPVQIPLEAGFVAGFQERPYTIESTDRETYVVTARLRPEAVAALFPAATAAELVGQVVDASDLLGGTSLDELRGCLGGARDLGEALDLLERWMLARLSPRRAASDATRSARGLIARSRGGLRIERLSREIGLSPRRLLRRAAPVPRLPRARPAHAIRLSRSARRRPRRCGRRRGLSLAADSYKTQTFRRAFLQVASGSTTSAVAKEST